jgi:hypothetical protein
MVRTERIILLAVTVIVLVTGLSVAGIARADEAAYTRGFGDAVRDYGRGHGYDPSCPSGHSQAYCQNYQLGYNDGWARVTGKGGQQPGGGPGVPYTIPTPGPRPYTTQAESWTLTVYLKPAFGTTSLYVEAYGPFGDHVGDTFSTGVGATAALQLPQSEFPSGYYFKIGVGTDASSITYYGPYTSCAASTHR